MTNIKMDAQAKRDTQIFFENLQDANTSDVNKLINSYKSGGDASWRRFIKGAYNHPITWWIGLLQIQMQLGVLGHTRKAQAQVTANQLAQTLRLTKGSLNEDIIYKIFSYNVQYRKADILGRLVGGVFTNYASSGGRAGNKKLPINAKRVINLSNFILASYGAAIKAVATGNNNVESIIQSILTGHPNGPSRYPSAPTYNLTLKEADMYEGFKGSLHEITDLTSLSPAPVRISDFCLRPENINLSGLCR